MPRREKGGSEGSRTVYFTSPHQKSQEIRLPCNPIIRDYNSLFNVTPSAQQRNNIIPTTNNQKLLQFIPITLSAKPRNKIIPSFHQRSLIQFIHCQPISRDNKSYYYITKSTEPITVYFPSPHQHIQEIRLLCHPIRRAYYRFFYHPIIRAMK